MSIRFKNNFLEPHAQNRLEYIMKSIPTSAQMLAKHIVGIQLDEEKNSKISSDKINLICQKLSIPLSKLAGSQGFTLLLSRSLALTKAKIEWFESITVLPDGTLEGFESAALHQNKESKELGRIALTVELLQLLITFIGEPLLIVIMSDAWPSISNLESEKNHD